MARTMKTGLRGPSVATGIGALGLLLAAFPVSIAGAQNALGDGRALDNNLSTRGRLNSQRTSLRDEFAFRNAVVTGNAPSGLSFRGDIGYRAPGEFTGELGSNDLFSFRRDSLKSGMAGMGIRGTEALQYQLALTTGARPPANLVGRYSLSRGETTLDAGGVERGENALSVEGLTQRSPLDPDSDERGTLLWMLRSPSAYISNSSLQTSALKRVEGDGGNVYTLTASPLRGVRLSPIPELTARRQAQIEAQREAEESPFGRLDTREDDRMPPISERLTEPSGASDKRGPGSGRGTGDAETNQPGEELSTLHSTIVNRLIERDNALRNSQEDVFATTPNIAERIKSLMERLNGTDEQEDDDGEGQEPDEFAAPSEQGRAGRVRFDPETMQMLRGDGTPLTDFVDPRAGVRDVYAEHLREGQRLLADGRYFDAEERFASALGIRRGDVTAQIGRLHAQIGAGLYLSASLNIQSLAATRPEVFGARYASTLMPTLERLEDVIVVLRSLIDDGSDASRRASPQVRQSAGLLLGYLGYQLGRPALIEEGMSDYRGRALRGHEPGAPLPAEARLADLLTQMWITEEGDG